jgi:hypothetical protein
MRTFASRIVVAAIALSLATPANAFQSAQTFVSHNGNSSNSNLINPCSAQNPCDSFATALGVTGPSGEINCLDSGNYSSVTISQSVTIDCAGQIGAMFGGITINGGNIVVKLRNLIINGVGGSGSGVFIQNAAAVIIENCLIEDFNGSGGTGIFVQTSDALKLNVSDTLIANNTDGTNNAGILIAPTGSGNTHLRARPCTHRG